MDASRNDWTSPYQDWTAIEFRRLWEFTWFEDDKRRGRGQRQAILTGYRQSRLWQTNRQVALTRANGKCERCRRGPVDDVHHLSYKHLFAEFPEDLQAICRPCHEFLHHYRREDPKDWRQAEQERFWREGEAM